MNTWTRFLSLTRQAAEGPLFAWPITVALVGLFSFAVLRSLRAGVHNLRGGLRLQFLPLCFPIVVLALGAIYACDNCTPVDDNGVRHYWAEYALDLLLLAQVIVSGWLIRLAAGRRFVSAMIQSIALWCTFWATFLAGMSISGDWL